MDLFQSISNYYKKGIEKIQLRKENLHFAKQSPFIKKGTLLLLRLDSIGDYILFRNFIEVLKKSDKCKNYHVTLCGNAWWKDLAENIDAAFIDEFIWVDYNRMSDSEYSNSIFKKIHDKGFEVLIHPTYSRDTISDKVVRLSGAKEKIGYEGDLINLSHEQKISNDKVYTKLIPSAKKFEFEYFRNHEFFEQLLSQKIKLSAPEINYPEKTQNKIIICPGAKDAFRRWSPLNFSELCNKLKMDYPDCDFAICGSAADSLFAKEIIENSDLKFTDYTGKLDLNGLLAVFAEARLIVTNDSGPFHIAVALNKKVVCISNGNNYGRFTPYPEVLKTKSVVVFPEELLKISSEAERLEKFCKHGSPLDINSIKISDVYTVIKEKLIS